MRYILNVDDRIKVSEEMMAKSWKLPVYVPFHGDFTEESGKKFREQLEAAEDAAIKSGQEIIPVTIDSYGGEVYALLGMVDAIKNCSLPVATIVESKAMSCGAILLSCGAPGHRYVSPNAIVMIHSVAGGVRGKVDEVKSGAAQMDKLNDTLFELMATNCGHKPDYFIKKLEKRKMAEWYLTAEECMAEGLADFAVSPSMKVDVSLDFTFG